MGNLAIIPARSGSKGLRDKNIRLLNGIPLIAYSINAAKKANVFENIMVSTDSVRYAEISKEYGADVPFMRSDETSNDMAGSWEVVMEVLTNYSEIGIKFDTVCLLQPTSPLRKAEDILNAYDLLGLKSVDAVTSVCEVEHSPEWIMALPEDLSLSEFRKKEKNSVPRQLLKKYYRFNGAIYIRKINYDGKQIKICAENECAYIMERKNSVDIDTIDDFEYAEFLLKKEEMMMDA